MYYCNENVKNLNRIFDQNERKGHLRLDLNENPVGFSEEFIKNVLKKVTPEFVAQYPETGTFQRKLAKFLNIDTNQLCLTNGSAEAIRYIIEAFSRPAGKVLGVRPTYAMYEIFSKMYGRQYIAVDYEGIKIDVEKILEKIEDDVDLLVLTNPNNPMGDVYSEEEMSRIVSKAKEKEVTVLIDEAYHYFYKHSFIKYALENSNVFVTRTFTKMFGLGSGRLGIAIGQADGIELIQKLCTPHNVNAFGMLFVESIIDEPGMLDDMIKKQLDGKRYVVDRLRSADYEVLAQEGNYIFIKPKTDATNVMRLLKEEKKILVKTYNDVCNMGNCLRVSTGERQAMEVFLNGLFDVDK